MSFDNEKRCAARLLDAIENGSPPLLLEADPAQVYLMGFLSDE